MKSIPTNVRGVGEPTPSITWTNFFSHSSFWQPEYLVPSAWIEHAPFAFWITEVQRPAILVELGSHHGFSYFCFCQAMQRLSIDGHCYAVDTWAGDEHAGYYGEEVYTAVAEKNSASYGSISTLMRMTFEEALEYFPDGSIDMLHIDGRHFYDDITRDFAQWLPKLSDRAIVLFHDVNVRERGFGVWMFWSELVTQYPHFTFTHGYGLGVLGIGPHLPQRLSELFDRSSHHTVAGAVREGYARLGATIHRLYQDAETEQALRQRMAELANTVVAKERENSQLTAEKAQEFTRISRENERLVAERDQEIARLGLENERLLRQKDQEVARLGQENELLTQENQQLRAAEANAKLKKLITRKLKNYFYPKFPFLFRWTSNYTRWQKQNNQYATGWAHESLNYENAPPLQSATRISIKKTITRKLKDYFYPKFPALFKWTKSYKRWTAQNPLYLKHQLPSLFGIGQTPSTESSDTLNLFNEITGEYVICRDEPSTTTSIRLLAFYLPQFHPIPENDRWWGNGFTEWTNVTHGKPRFNGHYQPHLPGELGFYDLRVPEVQRRQVELAKSYGIGGFVFYFYWFGGKRLLETPLLQYLENKQLDLPFCLCWANENWTRAWDGLDQEILIAQEYSPDDDNALIRYIARYMIDERYVRIDGKPLLLVYRPGLLPDAAATAYRWRECCRELGIGEIHLVYTQSFEEVDPSIYGFDAAAEFPPNYCADVSSVITNKVALTDPDFAGVIYDYRFFVERSKSYDNPPYVLYRGVFPSWDNEPRRNGRGVTFCYSSPSGYREWLANACADTMKRINNPDQRLVFVNAWNEWAEGAYLEPDQKFGYAYLQATRDALRPKETLGEYSNDYQRWKALPDFRSSSPYGVPLVSSCATGGLTRFHTAVPSGSHQWVADGKAEWADYTLVRDRISTVRERRLKESVGFLRVKSIINIANEDFRRAASLITLPDPGNRPDVSIVVPVYNNLKYTIECLLSVCLHTGKRIRYEVIVADDASTDGTPDILSAVLHIRLLSNELNLGFIQNCNRAAKIARGRYLLFLNNDVQVTPGWLEAMVHVFEVEHDVGAVGPMMVFPDGRLQEAGARLRRDGTTEMIGLFQSPEDPRFRYQRDVDYCSGACLLLETRVFQELGSFDQRYAPAYCEDAELCLRIRKSGRRVVYCPESVIVHHLSKTSESMGNTFKLQCIARNVQKMTENWQEELDRDDEVRVIAFYLPHFFPAHRENHPRLSNGFTEWTNVAKTRPNFVGHYQPRSPADLGYYDLRVPDVVEEQAQLATRYGIHGFCFFYGFGGNRLIEQPIKHMLTTGRPSIPFCLCWANENWMRRWDNATDLEIFMAPSRSDEDDMRAIQELIHYFRSPHYLRVCGKPLLLVDRISAFPDFPHTAANWRQVCREEGIGEIYITMVDSFERVTNKAHPARYGCDACVEFPPPWLADPILPSGEVVNRQFRGTVADYRDLVVQCATRSHPGYTRFHAVMPGWDDTARRQDNSFCLEYSTPGAFQAWVEAAIDETKQQCSGDERILFVNAWNDWAGGAYLEPDRRFGHTFLEAIRNARDTSLISGEDGYVLG